MLIEFFRAGALLRSEISRLGLVLGRGGGLGLLGRRFDILVRRVRLFGLRGWRV